MKVLQFSSSFLETELNDQPETKGTLLHTTGEVYFGLGLYEQSEAMFEKALPLRRQTLGNQSEGVAITLERLGLSRAFRADYSRAEGNYAEALAIWRSLPDTKPERISGLLNKLGRSAIERNDWEGRPTICVNHSQLPGRCTATNMNRMAVAIRSQRAL